MVSRTGVSELGNGAIRLCPTPSKKMQDGRGVCVCLRVCLCVCPAKYFLHYTANPISSFRKLCNVNSRVPFIEQLGPWLLRAPILLSANKMHTEGLSLPKNALLPPCPTHIQNATATSSGSSHGRGRGLSENGEKIERFPSQAQHEANFNSTVNPGGLPSWQPC